jgi:hypothetical protein
VIQNLISPGGDRFDEKLTVVIVLALGVLMAPTATGRQLVQGFSQVFVTARYARRSSTAHHGAARALPT